MPHDKHGVELAVGDRVTVVCEVTQITMQEDYCNVTLKTVDLMPPYTDEVGRTSITLNAKQVVKE